MFFSTGRAGDNPIFNEATYQWQWPAAFNQWGEFAGGGGGYMPDGEYRNTCFFFDGSYHDVSPQEDQNYSWATDVSDVGMVLLTSYSYAIGNYTAHLWKDSVSVNCDKLMPAGTLPNEGGFLLPTKLTHNGKIFLTQYNSDWQVQSIITLTPDQDSDGDGMPDDWEEFYGFDPHVHDANLDSDSDGTNNLGEFLLRSDPHAAPVIDPNGEPIDTRPGVDTDGDGIPNNWEIVNGMNYEDPTDAVLDFDRDGYTNLQEFRLNTDPRGAPSYRIRQIGPFTGVSSIQMSSATLGDGALAGNSTSFYGDQVTDQVFFSATPITGSSRPAMWSQARTAEAGQLSLYSIPSSEYRYIVSQSPSGAMLTSHGYNPTIFTYWSSPTAAPVTLSGAPTANNVSYLYNATFSPSGNFLYAIRYNSSMGNYEPIVWKMPNSSSLTYKPVTITAPAGASISSWLSASINDYGIIAANGTVSGQTRALVWTLNAAATTLQGTILPNLINNGFTNTSGLSNHSNPIIAGTALISGNQQRATVWKYNSPTSFTVTNLGTLPNGNFSNIAKISPNGTLAGISNTLSGNTLKQQIFCATPVIPADSYSIEPTRYRLIPQGEPRASSLNITHHTNAGEIIATHYSATSQQIKSLLRQGKSYPLDSILPPSSGYALETIKSINSQGTLFVTAWKDGAQSHLLLTPDRDTDGDGLPDAFENEHAFNPFAKNTPNADTDSDGLTDIEEFRNGTKPRNPDSDSDGMKDGWEVEWGLLPLDPTDALLDPDEDRVTNLRESQIGTIPTGIHKLEILHTDTAWQYPQILATGDDGTLIRTGASTWNDLSTESLYGYGYTQEILAQTASNIVTLPTNQWSYSYSNDWTYYTYSGSWANYYPDATSGQIHGNISRYNYLNDANMGEYFSEETNFLTPDITNFPEESGWISWSLIEHNLRNPDLHNGSPPLNEWEYLSFYDGIVSPSGTHRLHHSDSWQQFLLNERGEFIELPPSDHTWQKLNDNGIAACYEAWHESSDDGSTYTYRPWLFLSDGQAHLLPHDPSSSDYPDYELLAFSNDGQALLRNGYLNHQSTWANRYFLFDTATGALDLIRLPASANTSVSSLSNQNGRLLIQGNIPSQITPDGTCIRLDALRIVDSTNASPVPLSNIYPRALNPTHIASDGRITLTTTNSVGQSIILQIIKHNDTNNDGLPDDWQQAFNITDAFADDDGDGLSNHEEQELGTDPFVQNVIGPINLGFDETITDFPDLSFRDEHPSDLFDQSSISGWSADSGSHIEVWRKENESPYAELQSHWDSHGVKQTFQLLPKGKCNFILRYKGRYDGFEYQNAFKLKIAGADQVELDGVAVSKENGEHVKNYMEDDESDKYADWKNVVVSITAPTDNYSLKDITISLVPITTSEHYTYGGFVDIAPIEIIAHKRGTVNVPGIMVPRSVGEFGYETVMMENGNSQSAADSTKRDCELTGNLNDYRKANDNDLVKVVLKFPAQMKIAGASLKLLHEGMHINATKNSPEDAVSAAGPSLLKFYKDDGTYISNPELDLQIPDLANPPENCYLSKIVTKGEVIIFIEGADKFGGLTKLKCAHLGGARLRWEFEKAEAKVTAPLLVYRGGFLRFVQTGKGLIGKLEFRDGKGRVRHEWGGYKKEFQKDETDNGTLIASWEAKSGLEEGGDYNKNWKHGLTPPGWYRVEPKNGATPPDNNFGSGTSKVIKQGPFRRWKQDDETDPTKSYTKKYTYDASIPRDAAVGPPTSIGFQYNLVPIRAKGVQTVDEGTDASILEIPEAQNRNEIQIHPDGKCNGTAGCVGIQKYNDCVEVNDALTRYNNLKIKVIISKP